MKFVIATHNVGKLVEFKRLLEPLGIEAVIMDISDVEETGKSFAENAFIKAQAACKETGLPAVADDSGLCVDYLDGAPGQRGAHFVSAVCCVLPNGDKIEAEGRCYGRIAFESRGENGFGYDSIFEQDGVTFGELTVQEKDARSHRGHAFAGFESKLREYLSEHEVQ